MMNGYYIAHSAFLVETESATLLFDWAARELPPIRADKPLYVFISHVHNDHFKREVFDLAYRYPQVEFFLGYHNEYQELNKFFDSLPDKIADHLSRFHGEQKLYSDDEKLLVNTLRSTDEGVAFLCEIDGKTIYHAGDLFLMQIMRKDPADLREFEEFTEPLRGKVIDYAMLPLDSRSYDVAEGTIRRYMEIATIRTWSPMHLWGKYAFVDEFLSRNPMYASNMIGTSKYPTAKKGITVGEKYTI